MGLFEWLIDEEPGPLKKMAFIIKTGGDKGAYGEFLTDYMFNSYRFKGYYKTLKNIYIPYKSNTSEIDILLIHEKGLFVIESKNYSGWIFGSENQYQWTQAINKNNKNKFYNPIKQNKTHIKALSEFLNIEEKTIKSFIVFSERCKLKKVPEDTEYYTILKRNNLIDVMKKQMEKIGIVYTHQQIDDIETKLKGLTNVSKEIKDKHVDSINEKYKK